MSESVCRYSKSLEIIRTGILSLKATGADGFEGLLRIVLTNLTGIPFRLSASGLQGGMDGDAAMPSDSICFEAKRYSGDIPRNEVLTKIADLARDNNAADRLWILGATTEVSSQIARDIQEDGDRNAISTFILDWTSAPLPLLAIAVVAAGDPAIDFIVKNYSLKTCQTKITDGDLKASFRDILHHPEFENLLQRLKSNLNVSKLALQRAIELNHEWRIKTFCDTRLAKERLGQGLAVLKDKHFPSVRNELRDQIAGEIQAGKELILLGDEGHGKSWLSAQLCSETKGLALFVSAEQLEGTSVEELDDFLIDILIKQTNEITTKALKSRWRHRLQAWRITPPQASLLVVIDGLNQRQTIPWDKLLNGFQYRLSKIGGRLIVTVRPTFWKKTVAPGLEFKPKVITVPEWSSAERNMLLTYHGIYLDWLDQQTLLTLQNPRLLNVAITTLPHQKAMAWKGLTTDRLLLEHLRASQRENFEDEIFTDLTSRLSQHATEVLKRVQASINEPPQNFQADSSAVIETRFFRTLPGPGDQYELREEGLTLALGFTLVDQLWQTLRAKQDLAARICQLVEPIQAMDRTADVLFASLMICALDGIRFDNKILSGLLNEFANLQNVDNRRFETFVGIVKLQPETHFDVLKILCLENGRRINQDWFIHATFEVTQSEIGWQAAEAAIRQWLHCYNKDPVEQTNRYHRRNDSEYEKQLERKKSEIEETLSSLSSFEKQLLTQMTEVSSEPDELFTIALRLLAGRSLVGFAESFVAMGLAFSLNKDISFARKAFNQLTTFNRVERAATRYSFLKAIEPLRNNTTSKGAQWTIVRMLNSSGEEVDATEADAIAEELRKGGYNFEPPSPDKWRQVKVANPDAARPTDIEQGIQQFTALAPDMMLQTMMGQSSEDHSFIQFLPVACRFEPAVAIEKTQSILAGLLTRTGLPLRQLILNSENDIPLVTPDLAKNLLNRMVESDAFEVLTENDRDICQMFVFYYAAAQISAEEQLKCMTNKIVGTKYLLKAIPSLKRQPTEAIVAALQKSLETNDEEAVYGALAAALYGKTQINSELEELILKCFIYDSSMLRSVIYELAVFNDLDLVRQVHTLDSWNATSADEKTYEEWFGSMLLVEACFRNELSSEELLNRINHKTWFASANRLGKSFAKPMVDCFIQRLTSGITAASKIQPPLADLELSRTELAPYAFISIEESNRTNERFPKQKSLEEILDNDDYFDEKQSRLNAVAEAFFTKLKGTDAELLVKEITIDNLQRLVFQVPSLIDELVNILEQTDTAKFLWLKNLAFAVANLLSSKYPEKAVALLNRAATSQGFVTLALGDDLTLEHQAIWGSEVSKPIQKLRYQRLLGAENDAVLAREILAAERFGAADFITSLIQQFASSEDSLDQAYAITIAGYSTQSDKLVGIIDKHINGKGMCAKAAKHAFTEYENALWAQTWVQNMWDAPTPEEFWRYLIIAKTCMDARISTQPPIACKWSHYSPVFNQAREKAIKERNKERKKRLIGQEIPDPIFVTSVEKMF
ncbi:hypothetical protein SAMN05421840_101366 [Shewanella morhuae]|uniref:hypothetical protein n=1 Tax=Shewanella morhuae TaxID=365591 RepID=UPI00095679B8|nr:hypothetical protein [Shewanella morhuae]SIQ48494.1 hypothetical protein SAMN05421840_101366 [Shewanella morhuae]